MKFEIVATVSVQEQISSIPATGFYTSPDGGKYRASIFTKSSNGGSPTSTLIVSYDGGVSGLQSFSTQGFGPVGFTNVEPNTNFQYTVIAPATPPSGWSYDIYIVLEHVKD